MDQRRLAKLVKARRLIRRASFARAPLSALFMALVTTLFSIFWGGINAAWANDLEVIQNGLGSAVIIDVRTEREFYSGALNQALNHPVQGLPGTLLDMGIGPDEEIIVYCRSGRRSAKAKKLLETAGFKLVFDGGAMTELEKTLKGRTLKGPALK